MDKYYCWACDFSDKTGEGNLARLFVKKNYPQNNYQILIQERDQIEAMVRQFQTLNSAYTDGNLVVTSNYYSYIILLFVVIFLVFLLMRFSLFGELSNAYLFYGFILIVIILFAILYH